MEIKYYLPKLKELHIYNFDLYKCPLDIQFSSRLNLVFGTNGLGKTTLLNILQYAIIGPYTGKVKSRNWKDQQKLKRPMLDKNYFRNRMSNQSQQAEVKVVYSLGNDLYEVWHSLYEYKLKKVVVNGSEIIGTDSSYDAYEKKYFGQTGMELDEYLIDKYHRQIEKSSNFPHINSYILMITEMMFFTESRDFAFWEEELCKSILSKFMPRDKYFEYDEIQKLVKKYDSQARLTSYKMSMIKDFLGDEFSEKVDESFQYSLEDLQKINTQVDLAKSRIERIEKDLSSNEKEKTQNRIESERVNKKMLDIEKLWYENIFPDSYQGMFNRYVPSILSGKCPFCGTEHLDIKVNVENCFFCKKVIKTKEKANLDEIEIERKNLEFERRRLQNNFDLLKKENANLKRSLREEETELYELIGQQQKVKKQMDIKSNDNVAKYQQLELQKQEYTNLWIEAKEKEQELALEIDECVKDVFQDYCRTFKKYAYSFLGDDKTIELELVGKADDAFFKFYLNGTERESEKSLSESQRIFVDMAYRLATLEFFHKDSYFISETPDSTLDYLFEENAVKTFSYFINSGNTIFMSANARNSKLINTLVNTYKDDYTLVNLLKISNLAGERMEEVKQLEIYNFLED